MFLTVAAVVWAILADDAWWARLLLPVFAFIVGIFASFILLGAGVVLADHFPFWKRSFWRPGRL